MKRANAEVNPDDLVEAFDLMPKESYTAGVPVKYGNLSFKNAPDWRQAKPYRHVILKILDITAGQTVKQKTLESTVKTWMQWSVCISMGPVLVVHYV